MSEVKYWIGFALIPGIGRARLNRLLEHFGSLEEAWYADSGELIAAGLDSKTVEAILTHRPRIQLEAEIEKLEKYKVKALPLNDPSFPQLLKEIYDPPPVLYVRGTLTQEDECSLAVVGTRRPTMYGRQVTEQLVADLVQNKVTIVSGLARGIDTIAHRTALKGGGRTIAVFACGLDMVYPAENRGLAQEIMKQGALVSEYPLGTKPRAENFPRRNRIMSGLSLGVLVIEAMERSGALITANLALEENREVFAVPGSIFSPTSRGTNRLIRDGAKLVREVSDILEELNLSMVPKQLEMKELVPENEIESLLLKYLSQEPVHIDEICRNSGLPASTVSSTLTIMELKGMVRQLGSMNYILSGEVKI